MKIYVASSWRNNYQQGVVNLLRVRGHMVYDFKNPRNGDNGFSWKEIDKNWENWTTRDFSSALDNEAAERGFKLDSWAVEECDALVLVLPCGKSAHLEAGFACGKGKYTVAYIPEGEKIEPELMYSWFNQIVDNLDDLLDVLIGHERSNIETSAYWSVR